MRPDDTELWIEAQKRGVPLSAELRIGVNPLANVTGLRLDLSMARAVKHMLH